MKTEGGVRGGCVSEREVNREFSLKCCVPTCTEHQNGGYGLKTVVYGDSA